MEDLRSSNVRETFEGQWCALHDLDCILGPGMILNTYLEDCICGFKIGWKTPVN